MPGVKLLHQESGNNTKPEYVMGHSLQAISLLVQGPTGQVAAVPLVSRIHEGLVFSNRDHRSLLDKLVALLLSIARIWDRKLLLVADAYYANGSVIAPLVKGGHHLVSRVRNNAVAYQTPIQPSRRAKGRPRIYGTKVAIKELAQDHEAFTSAPSPVYGDQNVILTYRCLDLLWRPAGRVVRFVLVHHPIRGTIFLLSTDLTLEPLEIIQLYGYRFKIELGFRQAVHVVGAYGYLMRSGNPQGVPCLLIACSAPIETQRVESILGPDLDLWTIAMDHPHNDIMQSRDQLAAFRQVAREALEGLSHALSPAFRIECLSGRASSLISFAMP